jgi:hypothetical protein
MCNCSATPCEAHIFAQDPHLLYNPQGVIVAPGGASLLVTNQASDTLPTTALVVELPI